MAASGPSLGTPSQVEQVSLLESSCPDVPSLFCVVGMHQVPQLIMIFMT